MTTNGQQEGKEQAQDALIREDQIREAFSEAEPDAFKRKHLAGWIERRADRETLTGGGLGHGKTFGLHARNRALDMRADDRPVIAISNLRAGRHAESAHSGSMVSRS